MKSLDLTELTREVAKEAGCSIEAADKFVKVQDLYFDNIGVNVDPDATDLASPEPAVIDGEDMIRFIVENAGMAESFVRRLTDAERKYMEKNGFIKENGEFIPFLKGRDLN